MSNAINCLVNHRGNPCNCNLPWDAWSSTVSVWPERRAEPHRHDCYCSGWSHDDVTCEAREFYPCPDCQDAVTSGEVRE